MAAQKNIVTVPLGAPSGTTVGGVLKLPNPVGQDLLVTLLALEITTATVTADAKLNAGIDADGLTGSNNLIAAASAEATGILSNLAGSKVAKWPASGFLVVTATDDVSDLVGVAHFQWAYA